MLVARLKIARLTESSDELLDDHMMAFVGLSITQVKHERASIIKYMVGLLWGVRLL